MLILVEGFVTFLFALPGTVFLAHHSDFSWVEAIQFLAPSLDEAKSGTFFKHSVLSIGCPKDLFVPCLMWTANGAKAQFGYWVGSC